MSTLALVGTACFLVGVLVGVVLDDAWDVFRTRRPRRAAVVAHPVQWLLRWLRSNALILVVIAFAASQLLLALLLIQQRAATAEYIRCTASWQQRFSASYTARVDAAKVVSEAMDRVMDAVASKDPKEFRRALRDYISVRNQQVAAQEANPPPEPPQEACGRSQ